MPTNLWYNFIQEREDRDMTHGLSSGGMQEHFKNSSRYEVWSQVREAVGYLDNTYVSYGLRKVPLKM